MPTFEMQVAGPLWVHTLEFEPVARLTEGGGRFAIEIGTRVFPDEGEPGDDDRELNHAVAIVPVRSL